MAASSKAELEELHRLITQSYKSRIEMDLRDEIPTDAATLSGAAKFLKDNEITADPADKEDLAALQKQLKAAAEARRVKNGALLQAVSNDLDEVG
jgi:hypothetical protein